MTGVQTTNGPVARLAWPVLVAVLLASGVSGGCAESESERRRTIFQSDVKVEVYDDGADCQAVRRQLDAQRARFGRPPAGPFMVGQNSLGYAKERVAQGANPENVFEFSLSGAAADSERTTRWWSLAATDPRAVEFPAALLRAPRLNLAVAVVKGSGRYYVILMSPSIDNNAVEMSY